MLVLRQGITHFSSNGVVTSSLGFAFFSATAGEIPGLRITSALTS